MAAGYGISTVSAASWRSATEHALDVLASGQASEVEKRDAIYVLFRSDALIRGALHTEASNQGDAADHARLALERARAAWTK